MIKKLVILFVAVIALFACQKPYETTLDLAVDSTTLKLPSCDKGYFYMHIISNRDWTLSVEADKDWLHPEQTSGTGTAYPKFVFDAYVGAIDREATIVVSCDVKTIRVKVIQPKSE
ncbi:MAG: BACON domain-containing protein [Bacteroidales bacterium]|nr:BACON domain-containing protein [Bacteroidales bacterium]